MARRVLLLLTVATLASAGTGAEAGLTIQFDYSYENEHTPFFADENFGDQAKETLELAARHINRFIDRLQPIEPDEDNGWSVHFTEPGGSSKNHEGWPVPTDTITVIVGGHHLASGTLAKASRGDDTSWEGTQDWVDTFRYRGQAGAMASPAIDEGPWGGIIYFNRQIDWHFGATTDGLPGSGKYDFLTVAMHELLHVLGMGMADSWGDAVVDDRFTGAESLAVGSSSNPLLVLDSSGFHWNHGTMGVVEGAPQKSLMTPIIDPGKRRLPTTLDRAALRDVGWQEAMPGDANRDGLFDFSDLIRIFSTGGAKYADGDNQNSTWDEGDFNDDFDFDFADLVLAFSTCGVSYGTGVPCDASPPQAQQAAQVSLIYDPSSGNLSLDAGGLALTALSIESAGELLLANDQTGSLLGGLADVHRPGLFGKLDTLGMGDLDFGAALPAGLSPAALAADLNLTGSLLGGGLIEDVKLVYIPEPGTLALLAVGLLTLLWWRRRP